MIKVWAFDDAPKELKDLSYHGGDEDWLALVPKAYDEGHYIPWLHDYCGQFGANSTSEHELENGDRVYIGTHA